MVHPVSSSGRSSSGVGSSPPAIVFDLGHPAQFHLFRNAIAALKQAGHDVRIVARQKDCLPGLLDAAGWQYVLIPRRHTDLIALAVEQLRAFAAVLRLARKTRARLLIGTSVVVGLAARLTGATSVVFSEDDSDVVPLFGRLAYPTAHHIVTPQCLAHDRPGPKRLTYPSFEEFAYLHPSRYQPDPGVRDLLGVAPNERYFVIRHVAMKAHHDIGHRGLSDDQLRHVVAKLQACGRVFITFESRVPDDLGELTLDVPLERIFDVLAGADIVVSDGQTMTVESAVLGTPVLWCNTFIGRLSVLNVFADRYGLVAGYRPQDFDQAMARLDEWLAHDNLKGEWGRRRRKLVDDCIDTTDWMLDLFARIAAEG